MDIIFQTILNDYLILTLVLVGAALFLRSWDPPMRRQYQYVCLMAFAMVLVWFLEGIDRTPVHFAYGFIVTSLVFYGREYLDAIKIIKEHEKINHDKELETRIKYWEMKPNDENIDNKESK